MLTLQLADVLGNRPNYHFLTLSDHVTHDCCSNSAKTCVQSRLLRDHRPINKLEAQIVVLGKQLPVTLNFPCILIIITLSRESLILEGVMLKINKMRGRYLPLYFTSCDKLRRT